MAYTRRDVARVASRTWRAVTAVIGINELLIYTGVGLTAIGAAQAWAPAGYLVPGLVMLWMYLPQRVSFVAKPPSARRDD